MVKINVHHVLNILTFFFLAYICSEYASRSLHYISESLSLASFYKALAVCSSLFFCFTDFYSSFFPLSVKFKQTLCFIPTSLLPFLSHNFQHPSALVSVLLEFESFFCQSFFLIRVSLKYPLCPCQVFPPTFICEIGSWLSSLWGCPLLSRKGGGDYIHLESLAFGLYYGQGNPLGISAVNTFHQKKAWKKH